MILAIDPGTTKSAWVIWNGTILRHGRDENAEVLRLIRLEHAHWVENCELLAVEMFQSFGMPVGAEVFETITWIGRYIEAWETHHQKPWRYIYRKDVKAELCGSLRAKDANVRQALMDLIGPQGTKAQPGPTYGLRGDEWSALAIAVVAARQRPTRATWDPGRGATAEQQEMSHDEFEALVTVAKEWQPK